ncbi:MAG TPA: hypothetical protein VIA62_11440 [Thermoanaerobaculia bacterium]|jgi:hypothetical protein|nr:hypothetical protein [Thermoanaerobaculia bacterium]
MQKIREQEILGRDLRANPRYELVLLDRLEPELRRTLTNLEKDPDFYGVLRPGDGSGLGLKSVDRDTALLFLTLREPGALPAYVRRMAGESAPRVAAQLVADGILEIAQTAGGEGGFVSGAAAFGLLWEEGAEGRGGRLAELSLAALRHGQALATSDPLRLSLCLYGFNRRPLTPAWKRLLADAAAVERHLGIGPGGPHRRLLEQGWSRLSGASDAWLSWRRRGSDGGGLSATGATWKLYVSPVPEALAGGFGRIVDALTAARAPQFKIGTDAAGLLRPDKIVAYFESFERLAAAAEAVAGRLDGTPAQGVPFTSEIGGGGLVSWGVDPPGDPRGQWNGRESWRLWLTHRLAVALLGGKLAGKNAEGSGVEPWRFALERLRLEGVDTDSWTPSGRLFPED